MHRNSKLLFDRYAKDLFKSHLKVLEVGPDGHPSSFQRLVGDGTITWETIDLFSSPQLTYVAKNEYEFPIPDETFDIVVSGQVIEHVRKVWRWIKELARVCKKGGQIVTVNPVNWPYHEAPVDCWRVYPEGMQSLYDEAGLTMQLCKCESLELRSTRLLVNGKGWWQTLKESAKRVLGFRRPWLAAVDTISIGVKNS